MNVSLHRCITVTGRHQLPHIRGNPYIIVFVPPVRMRWDAGAFNEAVRQYGAQGTQCSIRADSDREKTCVNKGTFHSDNVKHSKVEQLDTNRLRSLNIYKTQIETLE